ncbi:hypothetical protein [Flavobacterium sp. '19STA2R22 D10 B1']|uniref:hypothetical protein n=1 Tax=Flavobacterium aerium TaxID=3037261 RepID=UPI00278C8BA7|nr:hypothetical protein [Flavobacterium sp. '19STA2R22 D10 B1']
MIVYDKNLLKNLFLVDEVQTLQKAHFITKEQMQNAIKELPILKRQENILIRLGFFLLGVFLYLSVCGVISLLGLPIISDSYKAFCYLFAIVGLAGTEFFARLTYYGYGLDDAFAFGTLLTLALAIGISTEGNNILAITITTSIVSLILYLRYVHLLSIIIFCVASIATLGYATYNYLEIGEVILPFVIILYSILLYYTSNMFLKNLKAPFYYNGLILVKSISLLLFYCSGNYYIVRELSATITFDYYEISPEIPFAFFFWGFTFIIPIVYLIFALRNKDRILLWMGCLAFCFSIFTFRSYHHILPTEVMLTFCGLLLFAFTYFFIKKIKDNVVGLTFKPDRFDNPNALLNAEALLIASAFNIKPELKVEDSPMEFGGGGFSGGGSGESF